MTRDRLYIDTMQQVYSNVSKVMVDSRNGSNLLYLPLDRLLQQAGAPAPGRRRRHRRADAGSSRRRRPPAEPTRARATAAAPASARAAERRQDDTMNRIGLIRRRRADRADARSPRRCSSSTSASSRVVYALGEIKEVITEPGLKFKLPPPFQNVVFLDKRVQTLDSPETRPIFTAEKKSLVIDWLVKWRIVEPRQFIRNNGVDIRNLESRLAPVVQAAFNEEVTKRTVRGVLSTEREKVMHDVRGAAGRRRQGLRHRDRRRAHQARRLRRPTSPTRSTGAWSPSASRWPTNCARRALPRARRSAPTPTASAR